MDEKMIVLGASPKERRISHKALLLLHEQGYSVIPVRPGVDEIKGIPVFSHLEDVDGPVHTITLYVNGSLVEAMGDDIIKLKPKRVIFNPGSESQAAKSRFEEKGIEVLNACTLVMLITNQF